MSGIFGDFINVDEIASGPKAGKYVAEIAGFEANKKSKAGDNFHVFTYNVDDASFDFPIQDWFRFPTNLDPSSWDDTTPLNAKGQTEKWVNENALKWFKRRLEDFGVPADKMRGLNPEVLIGTKVEVIVAINNNFPSITKVSPIGQSSGTTTVESKPQVSLPPSVPGNAGAGFTAGSSPFGGGFSV